MKISVVIPVYNGERYIETCLLSLQEQTYADWEAICVNDGSADRSEEILKTYAGKDSRIKIITQENRGVAKARDTGIRYAIGEYVFFMDVDDTLTADAFQILVLHIEIRPETEILVTGFNMVCGKRSISGKRPGFEVLCGRDYLKKVLTGKCGWELCAKMYKKDLFDRPLCMPYKIRVGEDGAVLVQLILRAKVIAGCNKPIYNYIQYNESVSHRKSGELAEETLKAAFFIERYLKTTSFYPDLKKEIDVMFLLFYSNSTRRGYLNRKHELVERIRKEHFSFSSFVVIPFYKAVYVVIYYWLGSIISKFI